MVSPQYLLIFTLLMNSGIFATLSEEEIIEANTAQCPLNIDCVSDQCDCFRETEPGILKLQNTDHQLMMCPSFLTPAIDPNTTLPVCCLHSHLARLKKVLDSFNKQFTSAICLLNLKELMVQLVCSPNQVDFVGHDSAIHFIGKRGIPCEDLGIFHSTIYYLVFSGYSQRVFESCQNEVDKSKTFCSPNNDASCDREKWFSTIAGLLEEFYLPNFFKITFVHQDRAHISQGSDPPFKLVRRDNLLDVETHSCPKWNGISDFSHKCIIFIICGSILFSILSHFLIQC